MYKKLDMPETDAKKSGTLPGLICFILIFR